MIRKVFMKKLMALALKRTCAVRFCDSWLAEVQGPFYG